MISKIKWFILLTLIISSVSACKKETVDPSDYDLQLLEAVNAHRTEIGLEPLEHSDYIWQLAREHSEYMANEGGNVNQDGLVDRYEKIRAYYGTGIASENVASGSGSASEVVSLWLGSISLKETLEGDFKLTGLSAVKSKDGTWYYTQIFFNQ